MRIAIVSPNQDAYSETFIKAHRDLLPGKIYYYYGGSTPSSLEGSGDLSTIFRITSYAVRLGNKLGITNYYDNSVGNKLFEKSLLKHKIDVVLAEYGTVGASILPVCKKLSLPLVVHFHGFDASKIEVLESYRDIYAQMFEYASAVVSVSDVMTASLIRAGCQESKIIKNIYGPNPIFSEVTPGFKEKSFVGIGRFVDKKAPYYTILAFSLVLKKHPEAKLYLAGNGILFNACLNIVKYLKIEESVIFLGVIKPNEYKDLLSRCYAFVQHSITAASGDMEGTPLSVLEASAAGLPVISTRHAGIPEVISDGITGLLINEHDVEGMADNMIKLLTNKELCQKLGEAGKKRIADHFSMEKHIKTLYNILSETV